MSRSCIACGGNQRLRPLWCRQDAHICYATRGRLEEYDFCRHCVAQLETCRWCGDAVGVNADSIAEGDWAPGFRACHKPWYDDEPVACYTLEWAERDSECGAQEEIDAYNAETSADAEDPNSDGMECFKCGDKVDASRAVTWHGDGETYCTDCFAGH